MFIQNETRGLGIAEGDVLGLAISESYSSPMRWIRAKFTHTTGLINEILVGRYELPPPVDPNSLLARHEAGVLQDLRDVLKSISHHRSAEVNRLILPHCQPVMEAIGHRMAYDAAVAQGVRPCLVDLYVANVVKLDSAWYAEHAGLGRGAQQEMATRAMDEVLPILGELVQEMDMLAYVKAPMVSDESWAAFVKSLKIFGGNAHVDLGLEPAGRYTDPLVRSHL